MTDTELLRCEGASDDTFCVYFGKSDGEDFDNCANGKPIQFRITSGAESLIVVGQYCPGVCAGWLIGVAPDQPVGDDADEVPIPAWPMHFERSDREYSPRLVIEVPRPFAIKHVVNL